MLIIVTLSAHGVGIQEERDSHSEGMELQFHRLDKSSQASSWVLGEDGFPPPTSTVHMMDA